MADATMARSSQDEAITVAAVDALQNYSGVRVWTDALEMQATNGIIEISGHVRTHAEKEVTENVVLTTKGVKDVASHLYVDTDLEIAVGKALGNDPRTRGSFPGILVGSAFGDIFLKGSAASADAKQAASEIAAKVDGVRSVNNQLEVVSVAKPAAIAAAKPAPVAANPAVASAKPAGGAVRPAVTPAKPAEGAVRPAVASVKPAVGGVKPAIRPANPAIKAAAAAKPVANSAPKPAVEEASTPETPAAEGGAETPAAE